MNGKREKGLLLITIFKYFLQCVLQRIQKDQLFVTAAHTAVNVSVASMTGGIFKT